MSKTDQTRPNYRKFCHKYKADLEDYSCQNNKLHFDWFQKETWKTTENIITDLWKKTYGFKHITWGRYTEMKTRNKKRAIACKGVPVCPPPPIF